MEDNQKPAIRSSGMNGFSEHGTPSEWDFGLGSVTGYRFWNWHVNPWHAGFRYSDELFNGKDTYSYLIGSYRGEWTPGRIEAKCERNNREWTFSSGAYEDGNLVHEPPEYREACGCGWWAYFDKNRDVSDVLGGHRSNKPSIAQESLLGRQDTVKLPVFGVIEGTGRVIIGEKGFRSQFAEVKALCLTNEARELLSWDVKQIPAVNVDDGNSQSFASWLMHGDGSYGFSAYADGVRLDSSLRVDYHKASEAEIVSRLTMAEAVLQELYPGAKILPDQKSMVKQFPPDYNYANQEG